jgi:hypothetical protein
VNVPTAPWTYKKLTRGMNIKLLRTIFVHINILLVKINFNKERHTPLVLTHKGLGTGREKKRAL